jgi:hypothetical protein
VAARADARALDDPALVDPEALGDQQVRDRGLGQMVAETEHGRGADGAARLDGGLGERRATHGRPRA